MSRGALAELTLPPLHAGQIAADAVPASILVMPCGRRFGKSWYLIHRGFRKAWPGGLVWIVEPTYKIGGPVWRKIRLMGEALLRQGAPIKVSEAERAILFPASGGEYRMRSADDPSALVSEGLDEVQLDEAGLHISRTFDESLEPTLLDRRGVAVIAGVPKGTQGLLYEARNRAIAKHSGYGIYAATTFDNPTIPADKLAELRERHARGEIPDRYFRQEYQAEFLPVEGEVFRNVIDCACATARDAPEPGKQHVIGVDWGKSHDWTVFSVWSIQDRMQVYLDRFRGVDYVIARQRLAALAGTFRPLEIVAEENAMGDPICEDLERMGLPITRFTTSPATKQNAVEALALAFEERSIRILPDPEQIAELQAFERIPRTRGSLTRDRFAGPEGGFDDVVMADAFAWSAIASPGSDPVGYWG